MKNLRLASGTSWIDSSNATEQKLSTLHTGANPGTLFERIINLKKPS